MMLPNIPNLAKVSFRWLPNDAHKFTLGIHSTHIYSHSFTS